MRRNHRQTRDPVVPGQINRAGGSNGCKVCLVHARDLTEASSNHPLQRQPGQQGEVPTSAGHGPPPPPAWAHAAAPGSLPHRELSKASTSTLEHTVPQQSGNRRGLPGPGKEAFQLPAAQPTASWRGRPHPLLAPYPQNEGRCGGMQPRSGSEAGGCSPRAQVSEEKGSPWPGQRGSQENGGRTGHEKQGGGSSEVEGIAGGCSEVDGTPDSGTLR